jgi:aminopeptidase N
MRRSLAVAAIAASLAVGLAGTAWADDDDDDDDRRDRVTFTPGASGLGDPFFELAGNGGYDVRHYSLEIDYVRATNHMDSSAEIDARATQNLSSFNLDLRGFEILELEVDGRDARFTRLGQELTVIPRKGIRRGEKFEVEIDYSGTPEEVIDPDESSEGWVTTSDGAFVVNEPQGSPGWYPANDNPRDKATYDFEVTVPEGITVIGNGNLKSVKTRRGKTTWHWHEDSPMAPYLSTVTNGVFELRILRHGRLKLYQAVDPTLPNAANNWVQLGRESEIIGFFSELYGPYPFSSGGGVADNGGVGYALESQTKSMYDHNVSPSTVVHEISHQWFGNAVTLAVWPDIWLNEGFARFSEWIYNEGHGGETAAAAFDRFYARSATHSMWSYPTAAVPGPEVMFFPAVAYDRGGMTLQALREKVGDPVFFAILRSWYRENKHGNVTTAGFMAHAERKSGMDLDHFFHVWLFAHGKPAPDSW